MRRTLFLILPAVLVLGGGSAYWWSGQADPAPRYRTAPVEQGAIVRAVNASGAVSPLVQVQVGSQVSGQIKVLKADFNTPVTAGQVIAELDAEHIEARLLAARADHAAAEAQLETQHAQVQRALADVESAKANLGNAKAQTQRAQTALQDAERDLRRRQELGRRGVSSTADIEKAEAAFDSARAGLASQRALETAAGAAIEAAAASHRVAVSQLAQLSAQIQQRAAAVRQVQVDLDRSVIRAPIDGVVVERNVDLGQTVAASLQAPILFLIAKDLTEMQVNASVDEADVGQIEPGQRVTFTVNAFPGRTFEGRVEQVRLAAQNTQNVVSYIVVVATRNDDRRLLPGMTATVTIVTAEKADAIKVPNAALRWRPPGAPSAPQPTAASTGEAGGGGRAGALDAFAKRVTETIALSPEQSASLDAAVADARRAFAGLARLEAAERRTEAATLREQLRRRVEALLTPDQRPAFAALVAEARAGGARRGGGPGQVWALGPNGSPRAVPVRLGLADGTHTEVVSGAIKPGDRVIVGTEGRTGAAPARGGPRLGF